MNDRTLSLLGLCRKAGKAVIGAETVEKGVREGKVKLVVFAADLSENSRKSVRKTAAEYGVRTLSTGYAKEELSFALGKHCGVLGIADEGFAKKILSLSEAL